MADSTQENDKGPNIPAFDEKEEFMALGRISQAMLRYEDDAAHEILRWRWNFSEIPERHKKMLPHLPKKYDRATKLVDVNQEFLKAVLQGNQDMNCVGLALDAAAAYGVTQATTSHMDVSKVRYTLKNLVRDWSEEGKVERSQSYDWTVEAAKRHCPASEGTSPEVLIPGAGLARLPVNFAAQGYNSTGNEFSYYMLLTSSFVMNGASGSDCWTIYPYVLATCNQVSDAQQLRGVTIPDVAPAQILQGGQGQLSMVAGDFVPTFDDTAYHGTYDIVATCFFIDTAHNILDYIEVIYKCLVPGGFWINAGPLLYHWAEHNDQTNPDKSLELSLADVRSAALSLGFQMVEEDTASAMYMGDALGMYSTTYTTSRWVMKKPL